MPKETLKNYLSGDWGTEAGAVEFLRAAGEKAAYRLGLQPADAEAVGVDFAAHMLAENACQLRRHNGSLNGYVHRAAHWFAAQERRKLRRGWLTFTDLTEDATSDADPLTDPEGCTVRSQILKHVEQCVHNLSPHDQEVYRLCVLEGVDSFEAAERLGCKPACVRKRLQRIRTRLQRTLYSLL